MVVLILGNSLLIRSDDLAVSNLKGIRDIIFFMDINGVSYRRGFSHIKDREIRDFNLEKVEKQLISDKVPLQAEFFKELYHSGVSHLKKTNIRIKEIYDGESTIIPILSVSMEIKRANSDLFVVLFQLMVSERTWLHPGKEKKTKVYIWYKKKMAVIKTNDLKSYVRKSVNLIIFNFIDGCSNIK